MLALDKIGGSSECSRHLKGTLTSINLYNFESAEADNCPYILTSPRSLKACSSANIKPIELLHRSVSEIAKDLNLPIESVGHIYEDYERERIRKLETCKLVRKHILQNFEIEQVQKFAPSSSPNIFPNRETISRTSNYSRVSLQDETPEFSFLRERKSRSPYSTPATPITRYSSTKKGKTPSLRCNLSSSSSSISSVTFNLDEKYTRSKSVDCEKYKKFTSKKLIKKTDANLKKKLNNPIIKSKNDISKKYQMSEAERMNDQQLCWQIDNVKKSSTLFNTQRNIKNSQKTANTDIETKKSKNKQNLIEQNKFMKNCEKAINGKQEWLRSPKKKKVAHNVTKRNSKLEVEIEKNTKKSNDKYNESVKNNGSEEHRNENERQIEGCDGLSGLKNHDLRILDAMALKRELQKTQDNFAQRARIVWASPLNEGSPNMNRKNLTEITADSQHRKVDCCHFPENITFETYFNHIRNKMKQLKEDSLHKELHGEHVRQLARELQLGMEQWQDQVLLLQWQALQRARTNARLHIENKRLKTQCENNERALLHALRLKNIHNIERLKQINMKKEIEEKDGKIEKLKMKREREILDCRAQAHYTAELREQLRRTLTPETFDQKVNDVIIKTRFTNRSLTASPFVESHIRLG